MCAQQRTRVLTHRNTNGVFNCFWLRSASRAWPIRRPEETVKNYLRKKGLRFSGRQCVRLCVTVRTCVRLWDNCSILLCVLDVRALLFVSTCEQATALWVRGRKCHIAYLVTCYDAVQYLGFPPPPLFGNGASPGRCESIRRLKSDSELWSGLEATQREKSCWETESTVLCDLCGVEFHPLYFEQSKAFQDEGRKLSARFTMHLIVCTRLAFSPRRVCHWGLCHWDSFLHCRTVWLLE